MAVLPSAVCASLVILTGTITASPTGVSQAQLLPTCVPPILDHVDFIPGTVRQLWHVPAHPYSTGRHPGSTADPTTLETLPVHCTLKCVCGRRGWGSEKIVKNLNFKIFERIGPCNYGICKSEACTTGWSLREEQKLQLGYKGSAGRTAPF